MYKVELRGDPGQYHQGHTRRLIPSKDDGFLRRPISAIVLLLRLE